MCLETTEKGISSRSREDMTTHFNGTPHTLSLARSACILVLGCSNTRMRGPPTAEEEAAVAAVNYHHYYDIAKFNNPGCEPASSGVLAWVLHSQPHMTQNEAIKGCVEPARLLSLLKVEL